MISFTKINDLFESESAALGSGCSRYAPPANTSILAITLAYVRNAVYLINAVVIALLPVGIRRSLHVHSPPYLLQAWH